MPLLLLLAVPVVPASEGHAPYKPIQPGALLSRPCTMNFVFADDAGALYIGAAAHCVPELGERVVAPGVGEFGTTVFWDAATTAEFEAGLPQFEYALVRIDDDKRHLVDPSYRHWGGPTSLAEDAAAGTATLHYAQGLVYQASEPTRSRVGVTQYVARGGVWDGWWHGDYPFLGGDSGSGILDVDGRALAVVNNVAATWGEPAAVSGPTVALAIRRMREAGLEVELVTAPFAGLVEGMPSRTEAMAARCAEQPLATIDAPDGCVRNRYHNYHLVGPSHPVDVWDVFPWILMANPGPETCYPLPYWPNDYFRWCDESVLIVDARPGEELRVEVTWPSATDDLDLYIHDADGAFVAASRAREGQAEAITLPHVAAGHYRLTLVPVHYAGANLGAEGARMLATLSERPYS